MAASDPLPGGDAGTADPSQLLEALEALMRELHPRGDRPRPTLDSSLDRDLGFDSLARVELVARLGRTFGAALPETLVASAETPRDLLRALDAAGRAPAARTGPVEPCPVEPEQADAAPETASSMVEVLRWHVEAHPGRAHIQLHDDESAGETISYAQLWSRAAAAAAGLQSHGLSPGARVALMLPTGADYFYAFYAIWLAGGVPVPIYPPVRRSQIEDHLRRQSGILRNCLAEMLITVPEAKILAHLLTARVDTLRHVTTVAELHAGATAAEIANPGAEDIALLQYTSGSTGEPKGVVLTHANLLANIRADGRGLGATSNDVFVSWLPLYHDMGLIGAWLGSLYHSVRLVIMSPLAFLSRPQRWLSAIHRYGGTLSAAPNFAFDLCLRRIDEADLAGLDLSGWRLVLNGAEPISPATLEAFCERFAACGFRREAMFPVYGLAEAAVGLAFPPLGRAPLYDDVERATLMRSGRAVPARGAGADVLRLVACGQPLPGHELRVVDAAGRELPERREGRLQFRGPSASSGYYRNPQATAQLVRDGWLETGDMAYIAAGDLFVTGRSKDLIIRAGRNIYPAELEAAVGEIDGVRRGRVAVFGMADPDSGTERVVVLAETRARDADTRERLRTRINELASGLIAGAPDEVVLAPPGSVLKTSSGKVRRAATRAHYEQGRVGRDDRALWLQVVRLALAALAPQVRRSLQRAGETLFALYGWALFVLMVPPAWAGVMVLPRLTWRWRWLWRINRLLAAASATPFIVRGVDNLDDRPCVLVCNHQSYLDAQVLIAALPRPMSFLAKAELRRFGVLARFLDRLETQFVQRFDTREGVAETRRAAQSLRAGRSLIVFPEGTFKRMPGLMPFHLGAFVAAAEAQVPVVPVSIHGTRSILRADSWFPRRGAIRVTIAEPIAPPAQGDSWARALRLRDAARSRILRDCAEPDLQSG